MTGFVLKIIVALLLFCNPLYAQTAGVLIGRILDKNTGEGLVAACVYFQSTSYGAEAGPGGYYALTGIPAGDYLVTVSYIGYETVKDLTLTIIAGETAEENFTLVPRTLSMKEEVTVTATRGNSLVSEVPSSVDVVSAEMIELENPQNLAEVLDDVQGVYIKDYGGIGGVKTISLRGSSSEQVLVLLDGQRLNNAQSGVVDFSSISVEGVERIEIVRGGNSAMYGADAVGGVINIITDKSADRSGLSGKVKVMGGSYDSRSFEASTRYDMNNSSAMVSYKRLLSEGDFPYTDQYGRDETKQNNDISSHDLFSRVQFQLGDTLDQRDLNFSHKYYTCERGSPGDIEQPYYEARLWDENHQLNGIYNGRVINFLNDLRLQSYAHFSKRRYKNDEMLVPTDSRYRNGTYGGEAQMKTVLTPDAVLIYGVGGRYDWLKSAKFPEGPDRVSRYAFLQGEIILHPEAVPYMTSISVIPALRLDDFSDFGTHFSPKIGGVTNFGSGLKTALKWNAGFSYRAPTFDDMYWPEDSWAKGNVDLQPEYGVDWDVGFRMRYPALNGIAFDATYFENRMRDLIIWQSTPPDKWTPENVYEAKLSGWETSLSFYLVEDIFSINCNYTYLEALNLSPDVNRHGKMLVYRPRNTVKASAKFHWDIYTLIYRYSYVSRSYVNPANTVYLNPYDVSDLTISIMPEFDGMDFTISFQVKNIVDHRFQIVEHQPIPGREFRVTLGVSI